ncbi:MAG TPA: tetratricopeptide repeat protein, partial [Longimicrobium sp.]|nr:tetratricopeptide repeat protein [Longimicrobium sp.]
MHAQQLLPPYSADHAGQVIVLEAAPGRSRAEHLERWLDEARATGATTWLLPCDIGEGGIWAGLNTWMESLLPRLEASAPELVVKHDTELVAILPGVRGNRIVPRYVTLTEAAPADEAVRNYALDRAYRFGHGVVNLLDEWHTRTGGGRWVVACDGFGNRGALVGRFFRELVRRRGAKLELTLLLATDPGQGDETAASFGSATVSRAALDLVADPPVVLDPQQAERLATELEHRVIGDGTQTLLHLHELIRLWEATNFPHRAVTWKAVAMGMYNHMGYYEDALRYTEPVQASLDSYTPRAHFYKRWNLISNLFSTYSALQLWDRAYELVMTEGLTEGKLVDPYDRARAYYMMAMLHVRFLPERNIPEGERCLDRALEELEKADIPAERRHFLTVFFLNGLALVRTRQGRAAEAVGLTQGGFNRLNEELPPDRHRLHRSVLLYNAAQVYANTGALEDAIKSYTAAMEMDPGYSEYYNERGNAYLKMRRLAEAERDYQQAIECSPPYAEVWTNLGQCLSMMRRFDEAVAAYATAIDLDPRFHLALVGHAQALNAVGRRAEAITAYDAAIAVDPSHALIFANRAVVLYEEGRLAESVTDLDQAIV